MVTVSTFNLEDLLAFAGGYLGLLLGSSIFSIVVTGNKMAERLATRRRTRGGRDGQEEGAADDGVPEARSFTKDGDAHPEMWNMGEVAVG